MTIHLNRLPELPRRMRGFTMIEALVALVILAAGMLGIAGLYVLSLQYGGTAIYRTQAVSLAGDMADRIRANKQATTADDDGYAGDPADELQCTGDAGVICTPAEIAADDLLQWNDTIAAALPNGAGTVTAVTAAAPTTYTITVSWNEPGQADPLSYVLSLRI